MNIKKIEEIKPYMLNCSIFSVYDNCGLTTQELLCQFFTKLNEVILASNESIDIVKWMLEVGLGEEVVKILTEWLNTGIFDDLISDVVLAEFKARLDLIEKQIMYINVMKYKDEVVDNDWTDVIKKIYLDNSPCVVYIPAGEYNIKTIKIPSNCSLLGEGIGATILNVIKDGTTIHNVITNADYQNGNINIKISNLTLNCNKLTLTPPNGFGSGVTFANCRHCSCEKVEVTNPSLHCFDVMANKPYQLLNPAYDNAGYSDFVRSKHITFTECYGSGAGDDTFTCHYSDYVYFNLCSAYANSKPLSGGSSNRNGFEVDDGSTNVFVTNCYATGCGRGFEVKAHDHSPAPEHVRITNCTATGTVVGYQVRHIGKHLITEGDTNGHDVVISGCSCINPHQIDGYEDISIQAIQISAFNGVHVRDFYASGKNTILSDRAVIGCQYKSRNVVFDGVTIRGFDNALQGIYAVGGDQKTDNVTIRNVDIVGCFRGVEVGSGINDVLIDNVRMDAMNRVGSIGVRLANTNPKVRNLSISNAEISIHHGSFGDFTDWKQEVELWSGSVNTAGQEMSLNHDMNGFDYLYIEFGGWITDQRLVDLYGRDSITLGFSNISTSKDAGALHEMKINQLGERMLVLEYSSMLSIEPNLIERRETTGISITKITGFRFNKMRW